LTFDKNNADILAIDDINSMTFNAKNAIEEYVPKIINVIFDKTIGIFKLKISDEMILKIMSKIEDSRELML